MSKKTKVEAGFNSNEIKLMNEIISEAYNEFINLYENEYETDKFKFSICNNDAEKYEFIERELKQIKAELEKVKNPVAGWMEIILSKYPNESFDLKFEKTIQNILISDYWKKVENLVNSKIKITSYIKYLDEFHTNSGDKYFNQPILENIIKYSAVLSRKEYLQELQKEKTINDETKEPPAENETNQFCKSMPLKTAKDFFNVFVEQKSKNKKAFLTSVQFKLFIEKAFCNNTKIEQQSFNYTSREKLFIVKRFYEFYSMAIENDFENTSQCKQKYIHLLTDNFTNWEYESIKNNFGNKVKRCW